MTESYSRMQAIRLRNLMVLVLLILTALAAPRVQAQALCGPSFGTTPPGLLCVTVHNNLDATVDVFMGPSPLLIVTTQGDYTVNLMATMVVTGVGISVTLAGTVDKTGSGSVASNVIVNVEGGRSAPLPGGAVSLMLSGVTDGTGQFTLGGGAGFVSFGDDLLITGFPVTCNVPMFGAGPFDCVVLNAGLIAAGSVAARSINVFQLNNQGAMVAIPSGVDTGEPVFPSGSGRDIVIRVPTGNKLDHFPYEQFRVVTGAECNTLAHYHLRLSLAEGTSLEERSFFDVDPCGAGTTMDIALQTVAIIRSPMTITEDYIIPPGQGVFITAAGSLTVAAGVKMVVANMATMTNLGTLTIDGLLTVGQTSRFDNEGVLNNAGRIENDGMLSNYSTGNFNNSGNYKGSGSSTIFNSGGVSNTGTMCHEGVLTNTGSIIGNAIQPLCTIFRDGFESE